MPRGIHIPTILNHDYNTIKTLDIAVYLPLKVKSSPFFFLRDIFRLYMTDQNTWSNFCALVDFCKNNTFSNHVHKLIGE